MSNVVERVEGEVALIVHEVGDLVRHTVSGVVGWVRSCGPDTDGVHVTAIADEDGEIINAPTTEFEKATPVALAGEDGSADAIRAADPSPAATPKAKAKAPKAK